MSYTIFYLLRTFSGLPGLFRFLLPFVNISYSLTKLLSLIENILKICLNKCKETKLYHVIYTLVNRLLPYLTLFFLACNVILFILSIYSVYTFITFLVNLLGIFTLIPLLFAYYKAPYLIFIAMNIKNYILSFIQIISLSVFIIQAYNNQILSLWDTVLLAIIVIILIYINLIDKTFKHKYPCIFYALNIILIILLLILGYKLYMNSFNNPNPASTPGGSGGSGGGSGGPGGPGGPGGSGDSGGPAPTHRPNDPDNNGLPSLEELMAVHIKRSKRIEKRMQLAKDLEDILDSSGEIDGTGRFSRNAINIRRLDLADFKKGRNGREVLYNPAKPLEKDIVLYYREFEDAWRNNAARQGGDLRVVELIRHLRHNKKD